MSYETEADTVLLLSKGVINSGNMSGLTAVGCMGPPNFIHKMVLLFIRIINTDTYCLRTWHISRDIESTNSYTAGWHCSPDFSFALSLSRLLTDSQKQFQ